MDASLTFCEEMISWLEGSDVPTTERRYVRAMELRPGNSRIVHHGFIFIDETGQARRLDGQEAQPGPPHGTRMPEGQFLSYQPGRLPEGFGLAVRGRSRFPRSAPHADDRETRDRPADHGLYFTDEPPTSHLFVFALMVRTIDIAPGLADYRIQDSYKLPVDVQALWVNPHAHYLGKEMKGFARLPDGTRKWLFRIKQWDFNWQGDYSYREPVFLPRGTEVCMEYTYDNSDGNPRNPAHPPRRVQFGQQSTDEMGELWIQVLTRSRRDLGLLERDFQLKTLAEFTTCYEHRLRLDPKDAEAHSRLGFAKSSLGKRDEAVEHFRRAIELDPSDDEPHLHLGIVWLNQQRYEAAQSEFETALGLNPNNYLAHGHLALLFMNQGRLDAAEGQLRAALRLNPNDAVAQENLKRVMDASARKSNTR